MQFSLWFRALFFLLVWHHHFNGTFTVILTNTLTDDAWHTPTLNQQLQVRLLSASSKALKVCTRSLDMWMLLFDELHEMAGRATPQKLMYYKMALQLHKTTNIRVPVTDWISLNINAINTSRQTKFIT